MFTPRSGVAEQLKRPEMRWVHPTRRARWHPDADFRLKGLTDEQILLLGTIREQQKRQVAALHAAGARLLVGTDTANPFVVYGVSVHEELALLVESGLSPFDALIAATRGPAEFLGIEDRRGTIASGKIADLVLVARNPLDDISATRNIVGVVLRGQWHPIAALHKRLDEIAKTFPATGASNPPKSRPPAP
jgi:adenine deaminase